MNNTLRILSLAGLAATMAASAQASSYEGHGHDRREGRGYERHESRFDRRYEQRHYEHGHRGYVVERPVYVRPRTVVVERPVVIERRVSYPEPAYPPQSVLGGILGSVFGLP